MNTLLRGSAAAEAVTGIVLVLWPETIAAWLFGDGVSGAGLAACRVAGVALLALAVACWPDRAAAPARMPTRAMFTYTLLVGLYLAYLGTGPRMAGPLLWPAVAAHLLLAIAMATKWREQLRR